MYYRATIAPDDCEWVQTKNLKILRTRGLISLLKRTECKSYAMDFYVWLWCWHDFHRDKKFNVPLIATEDPRDTPERQIYFWGGKHRLEVAWLYNQIFDTDYKLDAVVPGDGPGEPYYDIEWHKWHRNNRPEPIDYPAIKDHQTAITGNDSFEGEQVLPFERMFRQYPNGIIFDGATRSMLNNILGEDVFMPGAQNVWVKLGRKFHSDHKSVTHLRLVALICCILCKIPVNSPYFSLKFQE